MKIGFLVRSNLEKWGGDLGIIYSLMSSLEKLKHQVKLASSPFDLLETDKLFLTNTCYDLRDDCEILEAIGKPYSLLPFHEDFIHWQPLASGFSSLIQSASSLDHVSRHPEIALYYGQLPKPIPLYNRQALASARICIACSKKEAAVIQRDSPAAKTAVVKWSTPSPIPRDADDSFLQWTGLSSRSYLLQVGRLQARKNQLASIAATRNLDIPLVLIATQSFETNYEKTCIEAACKWRKAPTLFISQTLPAMQTGPVRVLPTPRGKKLAADLLWSAYYHAGLYLHPAFQELPGLVFLEAAAFGVPLIASTHCTIDEYIQDDSILFPQPHDLKAIEEAVNRLFGKRFTPFHGRTSLEMAQDFLDKISTDCK